jgi:glycosyltransferase involved in cell wall biosynthesis
METPIIGWIARMTGVKNPMRALEVADALPDTHFVMAGGGDLLDQVKAAAQQMSACLGGQKPQIYLALPTSLSLPAKMKECLWPDRSAISWKTSCGH